MLGAMDLDFTGPLIEWRGPAPFHFVVMPVDAAEDLAEIAPAVSYGWGMVPVTGRVGGTAFSTALWPKDGGYYVPIKDAVRRAEGLRLGDPVDVHLFVDDGLLR